MSETFRRYGTTYNPNMFESGPFNEHYTQIKCKKCGRLVTTYANGTSQTDIDMDIEVHILEEH